MTPKTRRQTTRTALIFSLLALLIVSIGCKKETKIPTPADANALIGTMWTLYHDPTDPYNNTDTIVFLNNGMYKQVGYGFVMNSAVDTAKKSYFVYTYSNGNGNVNQFVALWQGIPPNNFYIGHNAPSSALIFTITNDKLTLTGNQIITTYKTPTILDTIFNNIGEPLGVYTKRQNFNLYQ